MSVVLTSECVSKPPITTKKKSRSLSMWSSARALMSAATCSSCWPSLLPSVCAAANSCVSSTPSSASPSSSVRRSVVRSALAHVSPKTDALTVRVRLSRCGSSSSAFPSWSNGMTPSERSITSYEPATPSSSSTLVSPSIEYAAVTRPWCVSASRMRPITPFASTFSASTFITHLRCALCAKSDGGRVLARVSNSSRVIGSTSGPTFAIHARSPSSYNVRTARRLGCRPNVAHGCAFGSSGTSISSRSPESSATSPRTSAYSAYMSFSPQSASGTRKLNESAAPCSSR